MDFFRKTSVFKAWKMIKKRKIKLLKVIAGRKLHK